MKDYFSKIKTGLGKHLIDSTSLVCFYFPISAAAEKFCGYLYYPVSKIAEIFNSNFSTPEPMSDSVSLYSRTFRAGLVYLGLGKLYATSRDLFKKKFGIDEKSSEKAHYVYDSLYMFAFFGALGPPLYLASGETNWKRIMAGTFTLASLNMCFGGPAGHYIDIFRDLMGVKESERTPKWIKKQSPRVKKYLAGLSVVGLIIAGGLVYALTPPRIPGDWFYKSAKNEIRISEKRENKIGNLELEILEH